MLHYLCMCYFDKGPQEGSRATKSMLWSCLIDVIMIANFDLFYLRVPRCVTSTGSLKAAKAWTKRQRHRLIKQKKATKIDLGEKQAPGST